MKLSETDLDVKDREWAERVLQKDETLHLVVKPIPRLFADGRLVNMIVGSIFAAVGIFQLIQGGIVSLFGLVFFLVGLWNAVSPWRERMMARRSMYLLTNKRIIHLFLTGWFKQDECSFPLRANTQIEATSVRKNGTGDLMLDYEDEDEACEYGGVLVNVPQVERVAEAARSLQQGNFPAPAEEADAPATTPAPKKKEKAGKGNFFTRHILPLFFVLLLGGAFTGFGGLSVYEAMELRTHGETAQATVVGHKYERRSGRRGSHRTEYAIMQFTTKDGQTIREKNSIGGISFDKGEKVTVYYDPQNPKNFDAEGIAPILFPGIFLLAGLGILTFWVYMLISTIRDYGKKAR